MIGDTRRLREVRATRAVIESKMTKRQRERAALRRATEALPERRKRVATQ